MVEREGEMRHYVSSPHLKQDPDCPARSAGVTRQNILTGPA